MEQKIKDSVQKIYDEVCEGYTEERILGVFAMGNVNYGFYEEEDLIEYIVIYMPSFEEICTSTEILNKTYPTKNPNAKVTIVDIRILYENALHQTSHFIECVYTTYRIYNQRYEEIIHRMLLNNRELILHLDPYTEVAAAYEKSLVDYHNKRYFDAMRRIIAVELYINGVSCGECLKPKEDYHKDYLWRVKHNEIEDIDNKIHNKLQSLQEQILKMSKETNKEAGQVLKNAVIELLRISCNDSNEYSVFCKSLTLKELKCLNTLIAEIQTEGNFVVQDLADMSGCSRPVFKNMLDKMERYNVAIVKNQGVKGTYVKFFDLKAVRKILEEEKK